jgi:serine/threonine protein kinase
MPPMPPLPPFVPFANLALTPAAATDSGPMIAVIAACAAVLFSFAVLVAVYYRRKMRKPSRAKTGVSSSEGKGSTELQKIELKEKYKPILMSEIIYGDQLGTGAFGVVYKCTFQATKCAIKKLHAKDESSEALAKSLMDEFHVMSQLRHPNVLLTLGIAVDAVEGTKGIVMELMEASLADVLSSASFEQYATWEGSLFSIASDVANGLAYIHYNNMLHRDLKPGNVLLDAQWVAKVADFGTVYDSTSNRAGESGGDIQGTPPYMAPEIVKRHAYDKPVDVWAFGCMLAHMGTKRPPYSWLTHIETPKQLLDVVASGEYSPLELLLESTTTPDAIKELAKQCCQPGPIMRPTFAQISEKVSEAVNVAFGAATPRGSSHVDPRPVARIKNKRPLRRATLPDSPSSSDRAKSGLDQSYRDKFRSRSKTQADKSYRVEDAGSPPSPRTNPDSQASALFQTFSDTLLQTFTPGKGPRTPMDKSYPVEEAASPPSPRTNPDSQASALFQTFSDALATFTPGKGALDATYIPKTPKGDAE